MERGGRAIVRLDLVTGLVVGLVLGVPAVAQAGEEGGRKAPAPAAVTEPGPRLPVGRSQAVAQARSGLRRVYAATESGLFVSDDGGRRWDRRGLPPAVNADILAIAVDPRDGQRLYAGGRAGLWQSWDGGASWKALSPPALIRSGIRAIAVAPTVPETIYVGTDQEGVFRSPDAGVSWMPASLGLPEALAGGRPASIWSLTVHPTNPDLAYAATELHGLYRTTDAGVVWVPINKGLGPFPLRWRTGGPRLLLDPLDPQRLLAFVIRPVHSHRLQTRLFQSTDGGEHWLPLELELPREEQGVALAVDPADPKGVLLFTTRGALPVQWPPRTEDVRSGPGR